MTDTRRVVFRRHVVSLVNGECSLDIGANDHVVLVERSRRVDRGMSQPVLEVVTMRAEDS